MKKKTNYAEIRVTVKIVYPIFVKVRAYTHPLWQERERPFTLSFVLGYYTIVNARTVP